MLMLIQIEGANRDKFERIFENFTIGGVLWLKTRFFRGHPKSFILTVTKIFQA